MSNPASRARVAMSLNFSSIPPILLLSFAFVVRASFNLQLLANWSVIDTIDFDAKAHKFTPEHCAIAGVKVFKNRYFLTIPRWRDGVPATLLEFDPKDPTKTLHPFPSIDVQVEGDAKSLFQNVQSMEIDPSGTMWLLDVGRRNFLMDQTLWVDGQPQLILIDLNAPTFTVLHVHKFDASIFSPNASFANDIVVDVQRGMAYMTDTWGNGGLVAYSFRDDTARRFEHPSLGGTMVGIRFPEGLLEAAAPSDGIALDPSGSFLYYCSISRRELNVLDARLLRDFTINNSIVASSIRQVFVKGYSDGLAATNDSRIIWGDLNHGVVRSAAYVYGDDAATLVWPDTFAFDGYGALVFTTNRLHLFINQTMQFDGSQVNFRLWRVTSDISPFYSYME